MRENRSKFVFYWNKIPVLIRAILLGFTISTIGVITWIVFGTIIPMPWSVIIMIGFLILYWRYFSGKGWPDTTKEFRKLNFRLTRLPKTVWILGLFAGLLIVIIEQSGLVFTFRLMEFPAEKFSSEYSFLANIPIWAAWLAIIMISLVAGICEEIGFRGYMQVPLEKKYGPIWAIVIVSIVFVLVHLHQAWSGPIIVHIFLISALFGMLAYYSGSLIPGIVAHFTMDIFNFSFWWSDLGQQFNQKTVYETGIDAHFISWSLILVISIMVFVITIRKLNTVRIYE